MTTDASTLGQVTAPAWRLDLHPRVVQVAGSVGGRLVVGAVAVLVAFHFSLLSLVRNLALDTPLAYLGIVPFISVGIALALPRGAKGPNIHDRQLDHIIGIPMVIAAVAAVQILPTRLSTIYWDDRLDLLTMPFFVFAVSVLLFGVRATWRYRVPILFLFMAWPLPYATAIEHAIDLSTQTTIDALAWTLHYLPVATHVAGGDGSLFTVPYQGNPFQVSIASACAGVNSMVGFVLVGTAFLAIVGRKPPKGGLPADARPRKALARKLVWLVVGLTLVWALNIARLLLVLWTGKHYGETVAIDGLHPFIGVVIFAGAIVVLLMAMPLLGLQAFPEAGPAPARQPRAPKRGRKAAAVASADGTDVPVGSVVPVSRPSRWERARAAMAKPTPSRGPWRLAVVSVIAATAVVGVADSSFANFELTASDFGTPRLMGFDAAPPRLVGYYGNRTDSYDWVKRYFGGDATWHRYSYTAANYSTGGGQITADVIDSTSLSKFNAYGIEACYHFHGYTFSHEQRANLGAGVVGYSLAYRDPAQGVTFSVLYWVWSVQTPEGKRYERVVLLKPSSAQSVLASPDSDPLKGVGYNAPGSAAVQPSSTDLLQLGSFAQNVINHQPVATKSAKTA